MANKLVQAIAKNDDYTKFEENWSTINFGQERRYLLHVNKVFKNTENVLGARFGALFMVPGLDLIIMVTEELNFHGSSLITLSSRPHFRETRALSFNQLQDNNAWTRDWNS